jgi:hypothetical protein
MARGRRIERAREIDAHDGRDLVRGLSVSRMASGRDQWPVAKQSTRVHPHLPIVQHCMPRAHAGHVFGSHAPPDELPELDELELDPELDPELEVFPSSPASSAAGPSSVTPLLLASSPTPLLLLGSPLLLPDPLPLPEEPPLLPELFELVELFELPGPTSTGPSPGPLVAHEKKAAAASKIKPPAIKRP